MAEPPRTFDSWATRLAGAVPTPERLVLDFDGCGVELRSNSRRLIDRLSDYYRGFVRDVEEPELSIRLVEANAPELDVPFESHRREPGKRIKDEFIDLEDGRVVRKRLTGMLFAFDAERHLAYGPCLRNDNQVVNFINNRFIQRRVHQGYLLCHAAGIARANRGLAVAGMSNRGKSTLALHLLAHGPQEFVSNDRLMIRRRSEGELEMLGVPKLPRVNPGTLVNNVRLAPLVSSADRERLAAMPAEELWRHEKKHDVFIDDCFGAGRFRLRAPMSALVVLTWRPRGGPLEIRREEPEGRLHLMEVFRKSVGVFFHPPAGGGRPDSTAERYIEVLGECPVFEFSGGADFPAATRACAAFLETGAMPVTG